LLAHLQSVRLSARVQLLLFLLLVSQQFFLAHLQRVRLFAHL
jgi:hypothetical protein